MTLSLHLCNVSEVFQMYKNGNFYGIKVHHQQIVLMFLQMFPTHMFIIEIVDFWLKTWINVS